jgi:hypothetical protein
MNEYDVLRLVIAMLMLVLLSAGAGIAMLWQRQQSQADLLHQLLSAAVGAAAPSAAAQAPRRFEDRLAEAGLCEPIEPLAERSVSPVEESTPVALSEGEDRLLRFVSQRHSEPLHEHA